jgi:DNA-binding transcriptional MerR regulator
MDRPLSTTEVTRLLGLDERRVREWARSGLCRPARRGRRYAFSFQDLVVLRAAKALLDAHVPPARIRRAVAALARQLPEGASLSGLRIFADGRDVAVRASGSRWQPATGQTLFEFEVDGLAALIDRNLGGAAPASRTRRRPRARRSSAGSGSKTAIPTPRRTPTGARSRSTPSSRTRT